MFYNLSESLWQNDRQLKHRVASIQASKESTREELHRRLLLSIAYIHSHLGQKMLIKDIAKAAMLSEFHFLRTFKQCYGVSPNQYLTKVRMERAAKLLHQRPGIPVKEIADQCGYQDLHYFSKTFKKTYGVTPSGFRE
ncbi:MAG: helix-turn-helix transcriptional regulator [Saprospiraceae bacterium]